MCAKGSVDPATIASARQDGLDAGRSGCWRPALPPPAGHHPGHHPGRRHSANANANANANAQAGGASATPRARRVSKTPASLCWHRLVGCQPPVLPCATSTDRRQRPPGPAAGRRGAWPGAPAGRVVAPAATPPQSKPAPATPATNHWNAGLAPRAAPSCWPRQYQPSISRLPAISDASVASRIQAAASPAHQHTARVLPVSASARPPTPSACQAAAGASRRTLAGRGGWCMEPGAQPPPQTPRGRPGR